MARLHEFDRETALKKAMHLFWKKGYHQTNLNDLLEAMNIRRSSLYNSFKDKETLFEEAVKQYEKENVDPLDEEVSKEQSGAQLLDKIIQSNLERASRQDERTCLVFRSVLELADQHPEAQQTVRKVYNRIVRIYEVAIKKAQAEGVVDLSKDPYVLARYLYSSLNGFRLLATVENQPAVLASMAQQIREGLQ